ncbi:MAG TPA: septal ring lytic transglycosylase RlpA family protein [Burkholderiaceae bacterium]|nr:septal ring lytic transglycosylase RlpA family protein [Burkholderiaceae bacterium]
MPSLFACAVLAGIGAPAAAEMGSRPPASEARAAPGIDRSGHRRVGVASFYADRFAGRKMADGTRMDPHGDNAASRTLPLGTRARVTNLLTGQSALVTIRDRGPYIRGRIVDLSPATARLVGIAPRDGLAKVEVTPVELPVTARSDEPASTSQGTAAISRSGTASWN